MSHPGRSPFGRIAAGAPTATPSASGTPDDPRTPPDHTPRVRVAETGLLYENASTGAVISAVIALLLTYGHLPAAPRGALAWLAYMVLVSIGRYALARQYWRAEAPETRNRRWNAAFVGGTALAAVGWGAGALIFYPAGPPTNEVLLLFVIGGVMLGSASLLAARPEAFLVFLLPIGLITSLRIGSQGDEQHLIMGVLGTLFTLATVVTTWRFHFAIESSFALRFANQHLIERLQRSKDETDTLNRDLERRVGERTAQLLEADRRKNEFLATLAHELRNPLAPIRFALDTLTRDVPPETGARAHAVIDRQVRQMVRLVDDLLDVSRIAANKIHLRRAPVDLGQLMATTIESISPLANAAGHTLDARSPEGPIWIDGDATRLVQVFTNVLNNAVKFTPRGGHIAFDAAREDAMAFVRVRDTGIGIAPETIGEVFDMFHQAEPALERSIGGLGIGLTLARRLVQMHDGSISIHSQGQGHGTLVEIRLPLGMAPPIASGTTSPTAAAPRALRVLIVEDNVDAAEMMAMTIGHRGHLTRVALDGPSGVTAARDFLPDLIFLDMGLPVMNGYEVARSLRTDRQFDDVYIAAVTGWGQDEDRRKARDAGCDSHFTKPLPPGALDDVLNRVSAAGPGNVRAAWTPRTRHTDAADPP